MPILKEADLYAPVKAHMQAAGYEVRGEVGKCDIVGVQGDTAIAVELKLVFGLPVLYQALERLSAVDFVYVAVAVPEGRKARSNWDAMVKHASRLCRMLGVGLIEVRDGVVSILADPAPYAPRKNSKARAKLLGEFRRRTGDHNVGGTTKRPRVTGYREEALRCAQALAAHGPMAPARLRDLIALPSASAKLQGNVYGWFERVERGVYAVTESGVAALQTYSDVLAAQREKALAAH